MTKEERSQAIKRGLRAKMTGQQRRSKAMKESWAARRRQQVKSKPTVELGLGDLMTSVVNDLSANPELITVVKGDRHWYVVATRKGTLTTVDIQKR